MAASVACGRGGAGRAAVVVAVTVVVLAAEAAGQAVRLGRCFVLEVLNCL